MQQQQRPLTTQHGVSLPRTSAGLSKRTIQDASYWLQMVKERQQRLDKEAQRIQTELQTAAGGHSSAVALDSRHEILGQEIGQLQNQLLDLNLLMDYAQRHQLDQLDREAAQIHQRMEQARSRVHQTQSLLSSKERQLKELEAFEADSLHVQLSETQEKERNQLLKERSEWVDKLKPLQSEWERVQSEWVQYHQRLSETPALRHYFELQQQIKNRQSQESLASPVSSHTPGLSIDLDKETLLAQVRKDNMELGLLERKISEVKDQIDASKNILNALPPDADKDVDPTFQQLNQKEQEIQQFLDAFEPQMNQLQDEMRRIEQDIESKLEKMNELQGSANTAGSMSTGGAAAVIAKSEDWTQLQALEEKITKERDMLQQRIADMMKEIQTFDQVQSKKHESDALHRKYSDERQHLQAAINEKQVELNKIQQDLEAIQKSLNENETYRGLSAMEHRIRHLESVAYHLRDGMKQKQLDGDYAKSRDEVKAMMEGNHNPFEYQPMISMLIE